MLSLGNPVCVWALDHWCVAVRWCGCSGTGWPWPYTSSVIWPSLVTPELWLENNRDDAHAGVIVARQRTLTLGSSKINQHCWWFHGSGVIAAPQIIGLISFCTGMHHEYFFEVVNVLSCSPFMFENTENKQLDWRIRHSHLASTLFHNLLPWWRPRRIRPQITRLSQLENSAMGTWPIYKNSIIPDWFEKWRDIKFWYRC